MTHAEPAPRIRCDDCGRDIVVLDDHSPGGWYIEPCTEEGHVKTYECDWGWFTPEQINAKTERIRRIVCAIDGKPYDKHGFMFFLQLKAASRHGARCILRREGHVARRSACAPRKDMVESLTHA